MKNIWIPLIICTFLVGHGSKLTAQALSEIKTETGSYLVAAKKKKKKKRKKRTKRKKRRRSYKKNRTNSDKRQLLKAIQLAKQNSYEEASRLLFHLSQKPSLRKNHGQIKYILGLTLFKMNMNQISAFQFINIVKKTKGKYLKKSLEKLSLVADRLGDDTLLNYAIARVKIKNFPRSNRNTLFYRIGEFQMRKEQYKAAIRNFKKVKGGSSSFAKAKYLEGLSYAQLKKPKIAVKKFEELINDRATENVTDKLRVAAIIGRARSLYQAEKWEAAIEAYREVPRDTLLWHDALFESSWAMLRSGKFRSTLSNFHSLHSPYYEDFYLPESLLLRSIVYLYICKYDEMEKVLKLYNRIYGPLYKKIQHYLSRHSNSIRYYDDVMTVIDEFKVHGDQMDKSKASIPLMLARQLYKEGNFSRTSAYVTKLQEEQNRILSMSETWKQSSLGRYAQKVIVTRIKKAKQKAGREVRVHLSGIMKDLKSLAEQEGFIQYEMINGKKESLKKKVVGKLLVDKVVDEDNQRDYYIKNGYQYYPFEEEYWLDEIGNYHYVGTQSCN